MRPKHEFYIMVAVFFGTLLIGVLYNVSEAVLLGGMIVFLILWVHVLLRTTKKGYSRLRDALRAL